MLLKRTNGNVIDQKGGFLCSLMRVWLPLMRNVLMPPAKNVLLLLAVTAATDATIQKTIYGSGLTALIISNN